MARRVVGRVVVLGRQLGRVGNLLHDLGGQLLHGRVGLGGVEIRGSIGECFHAPGCRRSLSCHKVSFPFGLRLPRPNDPGRPEEE